MLFAIQRTTRKTWSITPTSGKFGGTTIAEVEGVNMKAAAFEGRTLTGTIKALWGATILLEEVYDDHATLRALAINKPFASLPRGRLQLSYDGLRDEANRPVRAAQLLVAMGSAIYAKGVTHEHEHELRT